MIYPPIAKLVEKTGSRYTLVIEAAKRARQISEGASPLCQSDSNKEVSIATNEIFENKIEAFTKPSLTIGDLYADAEAILEEAKAE